MPFFKFNTVPAHMGYFQPLIAVPEFQRKPLHGARDDAETGGVVFLASVEDNLGAQTDAEHRLPVLHPFAHMCVKAAFAEIGHRSPCRSDAWKDDMTCRFEQFAVMCNDARFFQKSKRPRHASQIACPGIVDSDH